MTSTRCNTTKIFLAALVLLSLSTSCYEARLDSITGNTLKSNSDENERRSHDLDDWDDDEVPVMILLGQSNTDGRAVYSFSRGDDKTEARRMAYPAGASSGVYPCSITATSEAPACDQLDLISISKNKGRIADGLGRPELEFSGETERKLLEMMLMDDSDWNMRASSGADNRVKVFVSPIAINAGTSKQIMNAIDGSFDKVTDDFLRQTNSKTEGWWELMQPLRSNTSASPAHLMNAMVGSPAWNGREIFGPEIGLALKWRATIKNRPLFIIKVAVGGSSFSDGEAYKHWSDQSNNLWDMSHKIIDTAVASLYQKGLKPRLVGIYWGQGESDRSGKHADQYHNNLIHLMDRVRSDLNVSDVKFFIQQLYESQEPGQRVVRTAQEDVCKADSNCLLLSVDSFKDRQSKWLKYPDESQAVHYTAHGQMLLGADLFYNLHSLMRDAPIIPAP